MAPESDTGSTFPAQRLAASAELTPPEGSERLVAKASPGTGASVASVSSDARMLRPELADGLAVFQRSLIGGLAPRFTPVTRLGAGSQGEVWSVADRDCRREMAFKLLPRENASPEDLARFILEAQITAQLEHPGIVPVHDLGRLPDGTLFYAMKRVEGQSLADYLSTRASRTEHRFSVLQVFLSICQTMAFAHSKGVIHRDLKPKNIMVGRFGEVLVMDWGLAKLIGNDHDSSAVRSDRVHVGGGDHETHLGTAVGTPAYMSPEQANGEVAALDSRCDIYSLGVILYEMLAGVSPYDRGDLQRVLRQAREGGWHRLDRRAEGDGLPNPLIAIVHRAMARNPLRRYQEVDDLANDVRAFLSGGRVEAYAEEPIERTVRWLKGHGGRFRALGLGLVLLAFLAGLSWAVGRESHLRQIQDLRRQAEGEQREGRLEEALESCRQLLLLVPDDGWALTNQALLRSAIATRADALRREEDERRITADRRQLAFDLAGQAAEAEARGDEGSLAKASNTYLAAIALTPGDPVLLAAYHRVEAALLRIRDEIVERERQTNDLAKADRLVVDARHAFALAAQFAEQAEDRRATAARLRCEPGFPGSHPDLDILTGLETAATRAERELASQESLGVARLEEARRLAPENAEARILLLDWCLRALIRAEQHGDEPQVAVLTTRARGLDTDRRHADTLEGLAQVSSPPGSQILTLTPSGLDGVLPRDAGSIRLSPGDALRIPAGRWLATGDQGGLLALVLRRGEQRSLELPASPAPPAGSLAIPGGSVLDGDGRPVGETAPFFLMRDETTCSDYLAFLNDPATLAEIDRAAKEGIALRVPRSALPSPWIRNADGAFHLIDDPAGARPVTGVSLADAQAYASWRSTRDGRAWRLPTVQEWRRAVQGGDGRRFPWGDRFLPDAVRVAPRPDGTGLPLSIGSHAVDRSVQGVRDLAGSVAELVTSGSPRLASPMAWVCGGSFLDRHADSFAVWAVRPVFPQDVDPAVGFRLALSVD